MNQSFHHPLPFGAELQPDGTTRFRLWAPSATTVQLKLPTRHVPMHAAPEGWHEIVTPAPAGTAYSYVLPDGLTVPDPASRQQWEDVHGPSVVVDANAYAWHNGGWRGRPWHEAVIYECHAGLMGGFKGIEARLAELKRIGITAIELMPIAEVPGDRNWGYDGVMPYAPSRAFGTPDELKSMIDAAHGLDMMIMLDVVYNHFGPDGAYIHAYAKPFFREDIKTPWGAAIDFRRHEVREYFEQNAIFWLNEYRFDGLRFDAVHAISEEDFLVEMAGAIRHETQDGRGPRHIHLVLEHENNRAALLRETGSEPLYDAQWADDWHHCLHVLLTGESEGYYEDFQDATNQLARCLADGFVYQGEVAPHLDRARGEPSAHLPPTAFVTCLQNHDQIGNRAMGKRLTELASPEALRAATALLLLSPFIPMLFMGEEYASRSPFQFFTSHNEELAELVREGRREEFKHFAAFQDAEQRKQIPDPNAVSTYERSRPEATDPAHVEWVRSLLHIRHAHIVPGIPGCRSQGASVLAEGAVRADWTMGTGQVLTILLNLGTAPVEQQPVGRQMLFASPGATAAILPPSSVVVLLG
jgi:maltooligosyltrehalose trehalohydrolase